jgi:tetratricopeptide (TPR) repeat protein
LTGKSTAGHKTAVQLYEVAVKLYPHHTYLCNLYVNNSKKSKYQSAAAHIMLKDYKQAKEVGARAVEKDPTFSKSYWRYGTALEKLGELDNALEQFDKALELTPDNKQIQQSRQNLLATMNK